VVESFTLNGFYEWKEVMSRIEQVAGREIVAMAPTMECPGIIHFRVNGEVWNRPVQLIGVIPEERAKTGDFAEFLVDTQGRPIPPSLEVPEAYKQQTPAAQMLKDFKPDPDNEFDRVLQDELTKEIDQQAPDAGAILGYALATFHQKGHEDIFVAPPGSTVMLLFPRFLKTKSEAGSATFTTVGYFKSGMSEYDSTHVYIPLETLQKARFLYDFDRNVGAVNQIQSKCRPGVDLGDLARRIQGALDKMRPMFYQVQSWEQKQGPLLGAVAVEQSILNILLFFIIAVAGFGILAIFSMIVVEKTR